jgi:hypothetical protein
MSDNRKKKLENMMDQVEHSRRGFLQKLLVGSAVALAIPASELLAEDAQDEYTDEAKGKGKAKAKAAKAKAAKAKAKAAKAKAKAKAKGKGTEK